MYGDVPYIGKDWLGVEFGKRNFWQEKVSKITYDLPNLSNSTPCQNFLLYRTWENFGVGKNWRIVVSSPIFYPPIISFRKYKIISVTEIQNALLLTIAKTLTQ